MKYVATLVALLSIALAQAANNKKGMRNQRRQLAGKTGGKSKSKSTSSTLVIEDPIPVFSSGKSSASKQGSSGKSSGSVSSSAPTSSGTVVRVVVGPGDDAPADAVDEDPADLSNDNEDDISNDRRWNRRRLTSGKTGKASGFGGKASGLGGSRGKSSGKSGGVFDPFPSTTPEPRNVDDDSNLSNDSDEEGEGGENGEPVDCPEGPAVPEILCDMFLAFDRMGRDENLAPKRERPDYESLCDDFHSLNKYTCPSDGVVELICVHPRPFLNPAVRSNYCAPLFAGMEDLDRAEECTVFCLNYVSEDRGGCCNIMC